MTLRSDLVPIVRPIMEDAKIGAGELSGDDPDAVLARLAERKGGAVASYYTTLKVKAPTGDARNEAIRAALAGKA
jgi:hypothetical protein